MYKKVKIKRSQITRNEALEGETIETKFHRIMNNGEPIKDGAPLIYTERSEGVKAGYNIRTDRFEVALDAMNVVHRAGMAKREEVAGKTSTEKNESGEAESTQGNGE